ncbi:MAG: ComF family protein [Candidatus Moranbacteria bacterium]|nr:ComF family protein [Candidatus Moranbacteria bacterium]
MSQTKLLDFQVCPVCEDILTEKGCLCSACHASRKSNLDSLVSAVFYKDPLIKHLIHNLKYRFVSDISKPLAKLISRALIQNDIALPDFLIPVPLHPRRLRWRGFNQSLLLASHISEELAPLTGVEILDVLERTKFNRPQMQIKNYQQRLQNMHNIFGLHKDINKNIIRNKNLLLVDDIATTGATLEECAKVLKSAGAKKVFAVVVARQSTKL